MSICRKTTQEKSSSEEDVGVLVDTKLTVSQECTLAAEKASGILKCTKRSIASRLLVTLPLFSAMVGLYLEFWASCTREIEL